MSKLSFRRQNQQGLVLILMAFIIGLGATAFIYKMFNASNLQAAQDEKTIHVLNEAKSALIAWSVSHPYFPGIMPFPDRNDDPAKYDAKSDCVASGLNGSHLIGRLAVLSDVNCVAPQDGLGFDQLDGSGERLWYSVSQNLIRKSATDILPVINPSIVNTPLFPWLVVRDRNGGIVSDRVAVVILASGAPLPNQDRSGGSADTNQYLDKVVMADGTPYKNYGYQDAMTNPIQEFIIGDDYRKVSKVDPTYKNQSIESYYYNDKLAYITIDELIIALEARAAKDIENSLLNYYKPASASRPNGRGVGHFPYAAYLGSNKDYTCVESNNLGALPIGANAPINFTCDYSRIGSPRVTNVSCTTGFNNLNSIKFERNSNNFNTSSGACSFDERVCTCKGAGSCSRVAAQTTAFNCDAAGNCLTSSSAVTGSLNGTVIFSGGEFTSAASLCTSSCVDAVCSGNGTGDASRIACSDAIFNTGSSSLSAWIMANKWYDYFYYANSGAGRSAVTVKPLAVGAKSNIDALLIGVGRPIVAPNNVVSKVGADQARPSCNLNDHLDSVENTNADLVFDATTLTRTQNYNDHSYIVAP